MSDGVLTAPAPAKINLVLEVTGRRPDGYHELVSVMQTLALAGEVSVGDGGPGEVTVAGPFADGTPGDRTNLAWRALEELARRCGEAPDGVTIALEKRVPPAGGLGGGASDAATVLRLLRRRWPAATEDDVAAAANAIGSDEAFFLTGGTALVRGRGERVEPLPPLPEHGVVLFVPPWQLERKTGRMFEALGRLPFDEGGVAQALAERIPAAIDGTGVYNAFERVAFDCFPELAALWETAERCIGEPVHLAGAGPTLFWIGRAGEEDAVAEVAAGLDCRVIATRTAESLWRG